MRDIDMRICYARADDHFNRADIWRHAVPGRPECVGCVMKSPTEMERIAARAIAKALVKELKAMPWHRSGNAEECSQRTAEAIKRESSKTGISELFIKSNMLRIQDGRL